MFGVVLPVRYYCSVNGVVIALYALFSLVFLVSFHFCAYVCLRMVVVVVVGVVVIIVSTVGLLSV